MPIHRNTVILMTCLLAFELNGLDTRQLCEEAEQLWEQKEIQRTGDILERLLSDDSTGFDEWKGAGHVFKS